MLQLNETAFLSRFNKITKQMTELLSANNYDSIESYFYEALHVLPEKIVSGLLYTKGIGGIKDVPEFQFIQDQVGLVMRDWLHNCLKTHNSTGKSSVQEVLVRTVKWDCLTSSITCSL